MDQIDKLKTDLGKAQDALAAQQRAIDDANAAIAQGLKEREAADQTIKAAKEVIGLQQNLIATYERAIGTLQKMVEMALNRIDTLEEKVDKANGRTATLATILTVIGIVAAVVKR